MQAGIMRRKTYKGKKGSRLPVKTALLSLVLISSLVAALVGAQLFYTWLKSTPLLGIREIEVFCDDLLFKNKITSDMKAYMGKNLLSLDIDALKREIRREPWIKSVDVERELPHTLKVAIGLRKPIAFFLKSNGIFLIDVDGAIFKPVNGYDTSGLIEVAGGGGLEQEGADHVSHFMHLVERYGKILCAKNIKTISISKSEMTVITRGNRIPLVFSMKMPLKTQFRRAESILYHLYSSGKYKYVKSVQLWVGENTAIVALKKKV